MLAATMFVRGHKRPSASDVQMCINLFCGVRILEFRGRGLTLRGGGCIILFIVVYCSLMQTLFPLLICNTCAGKCGRKVEIKTLSDSFRPYSMYCNCQRPVWNWVFSLAVSQHACKITNLWKFEHKWSSKLRDNSERKNTLVTRRCVLSDASFRDLKF